MTFRFRSPPPGPQILTCCVMVAFLGTRFELLNQHVYVCLCNDFFPLNLINIWFNHGMGSTHDWHALNHVAFKLHHSETIPYSWNCDLSQSNATVGPLRLHCNLVDVSTNHSINIQNQYQTWHRCWNNPEQPLASSLKSITSTTGLQLQVWDGIRDRCHEVLIVWKVRCVCVWPFFLDFRNWVKGRKPQCLLRTSIMVFCRKCLEPIHWWITCFKNRDLCPMNLNMQVPQRTTFLSHRLRLSLLIHNSLKNAVKNMLYIQVFEHQFRFWCLPKCVPIEKVTGSVFAIDYFFVNGISWAQVRSTPYSSWMVLLWGLFHLPLLVVLKNEMCYCVMMGGRTNWWKHSSARNLNKCQIHLMVFVFIDWWFHDTLAVEVFAWHKQHRCGIFLSGAFWICSQLGCVLA